MAKTPIPTFEVISIHPTLPEPMQWQSALELRSAVLWAAETPPATAADYYDADMRGEHLACVPSDPWETAGGSDAVLYGVASLDGPRLRQLAVRPDARRAGVGAALVEAAVARRRAVDGDGGVLEVRAWAASRGFYEARGFMAIGDEYDDKGVRCVRLSRRLDWAPPPPPPAWRWKLAVVALASYADVLRRCAKIRAAVASPAALPPRMRAGVLDLVPFGLFDAQDVRDLCDELGAAGRREHLALYASGADVAFPLLYTALLLAFARDRLAAVPRACLVAPGLCDLVANACHYTVLAAHPESAAPLVRVVAVLAEGGKWASSLAAAAVFALSVVKG